MFDLKLHCEGLVSRREQAVVHERMPEPVRVAGSHRLGTVHHLLLPGDGDRAVDRQLGDLPIEIQRSLRWDRGDGKLDLQFDRRTIFSLLDRSDRDLVDLPNIWSGIRGGSNFCARVRAGDERPADRGGREDAGALGSSFQVLEKRE